jgi:uncharacterized protein (DUF488 family)
MISGPTIWTAGHSTASADDFLSLLRPRRIELLADVRRFAASRRHPQFNGAALSQALASAGIAYVHLPELGGRREPRPDSESTGWREAGFRGYADYMQTQPFRAGVARMLEAGNGMRMAIMCAEKAWQNCHRGLIADYLKVAGFEIIHIVPGQHDEQHLFTRPARLIEGVLSYAAPGDVQSSLDL